MKKEKGHGPAVKPHSGPEVPGPRTNSGKHASRVPDPTRCCYEHFSNSSFHEASFLIINQRTLSRWVVVT